MIDPLQHLNELVNRAKAPTDPLLSHEEAAAYLGIAPHTLAVWRSTGRVQIPFVKLGRRVKYKKSHLDAHINGNLQKVICVPARTSP